MRLEMTLEFDHKYTPSIEHKFNRAAIAPENLPVPDRSIDHSAANGN
jgi:hypothetical protein